MKRILVMQLMLLCAAILPVIAMAQEHAPSPQKVSEEELKKANNPLANVKALNVHNYIIPSMYGMPDATGNQFILRYAQPFGKFLVRASMPFVMSNAPESGPVTGLGDFNIFAIYTFPPKNGNQFGIGPLLNIPTGTQNLGTGKWQTGLSALAFLAKSPIVQMGSLLQWQTSFAGDENRPDISTLIPQIFFFWQLGGGTYLRSTGISTFNLKTGDYSVPIGLGVGKVVKANKVVFNIFAEPQFTVLAEGVGQPRTQVFVGFNTQF